MYWVQFGYAQRRKAAAIATDHILSLCQRERYIETFLWPRR